jgi:hypothetical protein
LACQLLIEYVNGKSLVTQEEIDYTFCWRQGPVTLYPLKVKGTRKGKKNGNPYLPSLPYAPDVENPPHGEVPQAMAPQDEILGQI